MKFCIYCGTQLEDGVQFCPNCGAAVQEQPAQKEQPASAMQDTTPASTEQTVFTATPVQPVENKKYNGFAIAALVLGIASCVVWACCINVITCILAIIFSIVALVQIKKRGEKGKGMAVTGLILGIIMVLIFAVLSVYIFIFAMEEEFDTNMFDYYDYYYDDYDDYYYGEDYYNYDVDPDDFLSELKEA